MRIIMREREEVIHEYYTNIRYNEIDKEKALMDICHLRKDIRFNVDDNFSKRFLELATIIKKNLSLFQSVCEHVDVVTTIVEYLDYLGLEFMFGNFDEAEEAEKVISMLYTVLSICTEDEMRSFLRDSILCNSKLEKSSHVISDLIPNQFHEMIVLADSDLYAAISYLKTMRSLCLDKIWVQLPIKQKFLFLIKEHCTHLVFSIHIFRSKQELLTSVTSNKTSIISIWSEDIIAAKNFATSLNKSVLFINSHMDLYGGIVLLHHVKKLYEYLKLDQDERAFTAELNRDESMIYSLFYDGMWQNPVEDTYWKCDGKLWANATSEDIKRCISSAQKGYEIWSAWSINSRIRVLSKFASTLQCNGKFLLADIVLKWIKFPYYYENSLICPQSGRLEITMTRKPHGIIFLKAEQEISLFSRLIQVLISGNSVIVICNAAYTLAPYCDMFSTSDIPPGVINMLSRECIDDILNKSLFDNYEKRLFVENDPGKTYTNLTMSKKIIHPLK